MTNAYPSFGVPLDWHDSFEGKCSMASHLIDPESGAPYPNPMSSPVNQMIAIEAAAIGRTTKEIAQLCDVDNKSVAEFLRFPETKARVEKQALRILDAMPRAVDLVVKTIDEASSAQVQPHIIQYYIDDPDKPGEKKTVALPADVKQVANNIKLRGLGLDAAKSVLQTAGILASHTESRTVIALLSGDAAEALAPAIAGLMGSLVAKDDPQDVVDITPDPPDA